MKRAFVTIAPLVLLLSTFWLSTGPAVATGQSSYQGIRVSLVWAGDVIVPFAEYRNGRWSNPWPRTGDAAPDEPATVADLEKPWFTRNDGAASTWHFWQPGEAYREINAPRVATFSSHCQKVWGLAGDLPGGQRLGGEQCAPLGVALDAYRKVIPFTNVVKTSDEWNRSSAQVQSLFRREEERKGKDLSAFLEPPALDQRQRTAPVLLHLYRAAGIYYFEALKEYNLPIPGNKQTCNNLFFKGWLRGAPGDSSRPLGAQIGWTDCERKGESDIIPLGFLDIDNRHFIFSYDSGYEGESYSIWELTGSGVRKVLETEGGSC